ncbi:MAG: MotB family protein [Rhizobiales bacterium]|nr:MotB family protein [Hyphomicrobiales bacterium]
MADKDQAEPLQPIIIVKRGGGGHDEHHGGVWKIAFADFMTAMMAFFLVMWLINAANEETRAQVASYFNPVKLTDAVAVPKGVRSTEPFTETEEHDEKEGEGSGGAKPKGNSGFAEEAPEKSEAEDEAEAKSERALFQDPYAVLVEIAGEKSPPAVPTAESGSAEQGGGLTGGEAYRDPFDPAFWLRPDDGSQGQEEEVNPNAAQDDPAMIALVEKLPAVASEPQSDPLVAKDPATDMAGKQMVVLDKKPADEANVKPGEKPAKNDAKEPETMAKANAGDETASDPMVVPRNGMETGGKPTDAKLGDPTQDGSKQDDPPKSMMDKPAKAELAAAELKAEIMAATQTAGSNRQPVLSVDRTQEGLVVSLTDNLDFGMFASASARPNAEMVKFMDRIASVLAKRQGRLVVRGHTDSRPFRSGAYDNWRLSTARAHMAYHMLVRGGVDTDRFARIEGYADRDPRNKSDTEAAENRRIEILLVGEQP